MSYSNAARDIKRGHGSDERPLTKDLLARDSRASNPVIQEAGNFEPDNVRISYERYYDPSFARRELEKVWLKSWLVACREEDIPAVGDRIPFNVGTASFFIVRSGVDEFKAFYNACAHRGTQLCTARASGAVIRCPVHGWEWKIDGSIHNIPSWWDFKGLTRQDSALSEVKLDRWGGFIFISADPDCVPLDTSLGPIPRHFAGYDMENRYTAAHLRKLVPANWKLCQEVFQEAYHLTTTHPEAVPFNGDTQSQYDMWESADSHVARIITPGAIPSMFAGPEVTNLDAARVYAQVMIEWHYPGMEPPKLDPCKDLRKQLADWHRAAQLAQYNRVVDSPDAVMLDTILYGHFPHALIWLSESLPFIYTFTPHPTDPGLSYFEARMLLPCPVGKPRPPVASMIEIGVNETIADKARDFGMLGHVFDQDMVNMPLLQRGVQAANPQRHHSFLARYQESVIQHWHELLDQYMSR